MNVIKILGVLSFVVVGFLGAEGLEIRAYRAELDDFEYMTWSGPTFNGAGKRIDLFEGVALEEAPFKSRFFREGDELLDMTGWGRNGGMFGEKGAAAVYNLRSKRLVVRGDVEVDHGALPNFLGRRVGRMIRSEVSLYSVPGVALGKRVGGTEGGTLLRSLSCVHLQGQGFEMRSEDGMFEVSGEAQFDDEDDLVFSDLTWLSELEGAEFLMKSGLYTMRGVPEMIEVGAFDGEEALVVVLNQELVLFDGTLLDEWILKEEGGAFLREERLARRGEVEVEGNGVFEISKGVWGFPVTSLFETYLTHGTKNDEDPFATGRTGSESASKREGLSVKKYPELSGYRDEEFYDATELFRRNGVNFREGDYVVYGAKRSLLFAKATAINLELIEGVVYSGTGPSIPKLIRVDFTQVEAAGKVDGELLKNGGFSLVRKIGCLVLPGQVGEVRLGGDLAFELEALIDGGHSVVEMHSTLTEDSGDLKKPNFKTAIVLEVGTPVVVQQVMRDGKWLAWVVTAEVLGVGGG